MTQPLVFPWDKLDPDIDAHMQAALNGKSDFAYASFLLMVQVLRNQLRSLETPTPASVIQPKQPTEGGG